MTLARKELIEPARVDLRLGGRFPVPPHPHPRRGVPRSAEGDAGASSTSVLRTGSSGAAGERAKELDEIIGYHLEQAYGYREELGPIGRGRRGAGDTRRRATRGGGAPCDRGGGDVSAAASLIYPRGLAPAERSSAAGRASDRARRARSCDRRLRACGRGPRRSAEHGEGGRRRPTRDAGADRARVLRIFTAPGGELVRFPKSPRARFRSSRKPATISVWPGHGGCGERSRCCAGRWGARVEALERALEHARQAGDPREEADARRPARDGALLRADSGRRGDRTLHGPARSSRERARRSRRRSGAASPDCSRCAVTSPRPGGSGRCGRAVTRSSGSAYRRAVRCTIGADIETARRGPDAAERELAGATRRSSAWARRARASSSPRTSPTPLPGAATTRQPTYRRHRGGARGRRRRRPAGPLPLRAGEAPRERGRPIGPRSSRARRRRWSRDGLPRSPGADAPEPRRGARTRPGKEPSPQSRRARAGALREKGNVVAAKAYGLRDQLEGRPG